MVSHWHTALTASPSCPPCPPAAAAPKPPTKQCSEGENGCLRCQNDKRCRACALGYRLGAAGVCKKCQVEGCLRCPGSINYCTACDRSRGYRRTGNYQCVQRA